MTRRTFLACLAGAACLLASGPAWPCGLEAIAAEFRHLRTVRGHFQGGSWNDEVDRWGGRKHEVMGRLAEALGVPGTAEDRVTGLMGPPDERSEPGRLAFRLAEPPEGTTHLLVYHWRGWHDFLYFACRGPEVRGAGWWMAGE